MSLFSTKTVTVLICVNYITAINSSALGATRHGDLPFSVGSNQRGPPRELQWTGKVAGRESTIKGSHMPSSCSHGVNDNGNGCANPPQSPPDTYPQNQPIRSYPSRTGNALANRLAMQHQKPSTDDANGGSTNLTTSRMITDVSLIFKFIHLIEAIFNLLTATLWGH